MVIDMAYYNDYKKFGNQPAAIQPDGSRISYCELSEVSEAIGKVLEGRKLAFSFCENSIGSLCGYISFLEHGVVPALFDTHMDEELCGHLLERYQPDYLFVPESLAERFGDREILWEGFGYRLLRMYPHSQVRVYQELGLLLSTSGSTGSPKLVRQSYQNIQSNAEAIAEYLEIGADERPITTLPMNYTYGLSIINSHLLRGATILMTSFPLLQKEFWNFFKEQEATSFGGVPYHYEILKKLRFFRMELPSLRYMTQAGGKLAPELHKEFADYAAEHHKKFIVMYGQTEATARMAYLPAEHALEKCGSMGIAIPGGRLELIGVDGNVIQEPEVVGELVYYGPNVTLGYAESGQELLKGDERQGRLETGDMAKRDRDGYYTVVGRKKRFLKIFGNRVNLDETERMIRQYLNEGSGLESRDCACVGKDDEMVVYITGIDEIIKEELRKFLSHKTGLHVSAFVIKEIDEIPKSESGKILYSALHS